MGVCAKRLWHADKNIGWRYTDIILIYTKHRLTQQLKRCFCNMQGNHIQSTPCVFSLQPALCAWKYLIWPFRGIPRTVFSNFPSFGTPRKLVSWNFEASGPPDGSFSPKTSRRGIPKHCFSEFQPFGMSRSPTFPVFLLVACERNAVFSVFCISLTSDGPFSAFFARRLQAKRCFSHFLHFAHERRMIFSIFWLSPAGESQFLLLFRFPSQGKTVFCCFLVFPHEGKLIFAEFWFSPMRESQFFLSFIHPRPRTTVFFVFC